MDFLNFRLSLKKVLGEETGKGRTARWRVKPGGEKNTNKNKKTKITEIISKQHPVAEGSERGLVCTGPGFGPATPTA